MPKREIRGTWWFPNNPSKRWVGHLSLVNEKSPRLNFVVPNDAGFEAPPYPATLFGEDEHGKPVSLLRLGRVNLNSTFRICEASYEAGHAVLGVHVLNTTDLQVGTFDVYLQQLGGWLWRSGFDRSLETSHSEELTIRYQRPPDLQFNIRDTLSVELVTCVTRWASIREQGIREDSCFHFEAAATIDFDKARELISSAVQILHFASLEPVYPIRVEGSSAATTHNEPKRFEWISGWMHEDTKSQIDPDWWVFRFSDVQEEFGRFWSRWLDARSRYQEALGCYFTTVYHSLPSSVEHLCLTQALEAYHGVRNATHHRDFELKIRELVNDHKQSLSGLFDDPEEFATTVRHNRNYYTHHNPRWLSDGRVAVGNDLFRLNQKLLLLFQACMLQELQIPPDRCRRLRRQLATHIVDYY
jgi:ApeA N-terminal domain 1